MDQESGNLHDSLRNILTSYIAPINTVEEFFGLESSKKKQCIQYTVYSRIASSDVDFQMSDQLSTIAFLANNNRFELLRPLITLILAKEAKSDQEMLEFIKHDFKPTPAPSTFTSKRVRTGATSSATSSPFTSKRVRTSATSTLTNSSSHLRDFIRESDVLSLYTNVPGLVERFIPEDGIDLQPHEILINEKLNEELNDTSERSILEWITPLVGHLCTWLDKRNPNNRNSRTWQAHPTRFSEGVDAKRMLDGAIMSRHFNNENDIRDVLVPVELKKNNTEARYAALCLAKHVCEVFEAQPTRSFVIGLTLCGTSMQLWQFDRSGAIGSESFDVKANKGNLEKFLTIMLSLLTCDEQTLGFDPTFIEVQGPRPNTPGLRMSQAIRIQTETGSQGFVIEKLIARASGICGRGTTCWQAHLSGDEGTKFLIKDSWQPLGQREEGDMLRDVTAQNVSHVARYHHHEDVCVDGKKVDIESSVRKDLNFKSCPKLRTTQASVESQEPNGFTNHVHRRLILKDVGQPICGVDGPIHLLEALEGCVEGHHNLLRAGYLHGDISIHNLMISKQATDLNRKSFLIDLDLAVPWPVENEKDLHFRTGTKVFMSSNLLRNEKPQHFVDDLESFFWVLIWICIHSPGGERTENEVTSWDHWASEELGHLKKSLLSEPEYLTNRFTSPYKHAEPLISCVHAFAKIVCHPCLRTRDHEQLYAPILASLRMAQEKLVGLRQQPSQS
ncbi:hypothetical protein PGT21_013148 [Puccinia graminis f. sp. tritici]|uniref:Fungal-type protein kinase domain-containing protein n=1 Tax=Puccinia graminis f. sp. tritici TaxID=56615 RepID=A0A5B0SC52_PUCGR|nr:hypothetical protein PGT21_013148 [Puccinia graminis f. sp. tritici]KAA1134014.1 hypothetical protein PGTUg99_015090 [Puccinia graminis f. sp. tritici]